MTTSWEADYDVLAIDGDVFVAHGRTRYLTDDRSGVDREFANVFGVGSTRTAAVASSRSTTCARRRTEPAVEESVVD